MRRRPCACRKTEDVACLQHDAIRQRGTERRHNKQPHDARRAQHEHITAVPPTADGTAIDHERAGRGTSTPSRKTSTPGSRSLSAAGGVLFVSAPTPCNLSYSVPAR